MTVEAYYDQGVYGQSYYDNINPVELITLSENACEITLSETEKIEET